MHDPRLVYGFFRDPHESQIEDINRSSFRLCRKLGIDSHNQNVIIEEKEDYVQFHLTNQTAYVSDKIEFADPAFVNKLESRIMNQQPSKRKRGSKTRKPLGGSPTAIKTSPSYQLGRQPKTQKTTERNAKG